MKCFTAPLLLFAALVLTGYAVAGSTNKSDDNDAAVVQTLDESGAQQIQDAEPLPLSRNGLTDKQKALCDIAFNNGSGTKFDSETAYVQACLGLFPKNDQDID